MLTTPAIFATQFSPLHQFEAGRGLLRKYLTFLKATKTEIIREVFRCYRSIAHRNKLSPRATATSGRSHFRKPHLKQHEVVMVLFNCFSLLPQFIPLKMRYCATLQLTQVNFCKKRIIMFLLLSISKISFL